MSLTVSGLARAFACAASVLLPQTHKDDDEFQAWGRALHAFLRDCNELGRNAALERAPETYRYKLQVIDIDDLPLDNAKWASEVCFVYENGECREVSRGDSSRPYASDANGSKLWGTADVVGASEDAVIVADFKAGWMDLGPIADNWQLRGYCVQASRAYRKDRAIAMTISFRDPNDPRIETAEFSALDLDSFEAQIVKLMEPKPIPAFTEGQHCPRCPSFSFCPTKAGLAGMMAANPSSVAPPVLNAENARAVYERAKAAREVIERVEASLEEFARLEPIDLGNGQMYGATEHTVEKIDPLLAAPVLQGLSLYGALQTKMSVTKEALAEEIRKKLLADNGGKIPRGAIGKTEKAITAKLQEAGALTKYTTRPVTVYRPKELKP